MCLSNIEIIFFSLLILVVVVIIIVIPLIPAFSTEIAVHLPCRLGVIIKHSKLTVAAGAKVYLFVIICILFLIARLAQ